MLKSISKIENVDKPTIIVGWSKAKSLYPNQKITNKEIGDNIFWTFSEKEKRTENVADLDKFKKFCLSKFEGQYKYFFLNPFEVNYSNIKKIIQKIDTITEKVCFFDGKEFFILVDNVVLGLNLDFLSLISFTENRVKTWIKSKNFEIFEGIDIFNIEGINTEHKRHLIPIINREKKYEKEFIIGYVLE